MNIAQTIFIFNQVLKRIRWQQDSSLPPPVLIHDTLDHWTTVSCQLYKYLKYFTFDSISQKWVFFVRNLFEMVAMPIPLLFGDCYVSRGVECDISVDDGLLII